MEFARFAIDNPSFRFISVFTYQEVRIPSRIPEDAIEDAMIVSPPIIVLKNAHDNTENGEVDGNDGAIHGMRPLLSSFISITHGVR